MAIDKAVLKEMVGKRITIDGVKHRVEKVVMKTGLITTRDGTEALAEGVYKKGPGFFYDSPTKGKKKAAAKEEAPVKETARARRAREKQEAEEPVETAREKRLRLKKEKEEAEVKEAKTSRRKSDKTPGAKGDGTKAPGKKKKLFEAFNQAIAERISQESYDLLSSAYGANGDYAITPVAVGAAFEEDALVISITVMSASKTAKEIKDYIRNHREATDIASSDEEDDDLDDDDLEDDDAEDQDLEDDESLEDDDDSEEEDDDSEDAFEAALNELSLKDLRKIAKEMEIDDYKDFNKEDLAQELSEYEEDDVREAATEAGVELASSDDEDDDSDDDSDDDDDDSDEEQEESATVEDLVGEVLEVAPEMKAKSITKFVEAFLANDECQEKFDGELVPGRTQLQEKGNKGPEMLLLGYDEANEVIKLLNISTGKTRSKTISEVVHMEILEAAE